MDNSKKKESPFNLQARADQIAAEKAEKEALDKHPSRKFDPDTMRQRTMMGGGFKPANQAQRDGTTRLEYDTPPESRLSDAATEAAERKGPSQDAAKR